MEICTVILPLPPSILSPNRPPGTRGGRFARAAAAKKYRRLAWEATEAIGIETGPWERATVQATFYHRQERRRDEWNHEAMLKPAIDGIVDAGLLADDDTKHLTSLPAVFLVDRKASRVELSLVRIK